MPQATRLFQFLLERRSLEAPDQSSPPFQVGTMAHRTAVVKSHLPKLRLTSGESWESNPFQSISRLALPDAVAELTRMLAVAVSPRRQRTLRRSMRLRSPMHNFLSRSPSNVLFIADAAADQQACLLLPQAEIPHKKMTGVNNLRT